MEVFRYFIADKTLIFFFQKVSLLENKFIEGLKQVLAGDMYSLAELLYPEDFTEETSENGIVLIPFE